MLEITDLGHSYGRGGGTHLAVDGISLKAEKGEIVSIVGASGCGKSTVLRCIAGLQRPTRGTIRVNGAVVDAVVPDGLAVVFQDYSRSLYPWLSVRDNVALPLVRTQASRAQRRRTAEDALEAVGLGGTGHRYPWQLSGGMQQRVAIARAIACAPVLAGFVRHSGSIGHWTGIRSTRHRLSSCQPRRWLRLPPDRGSALREPSRRRGAFASRVPDS